MGLPRRPPGWVGRHRVVVAPPKTNKDEKLLCYLWATRNRTTTTRRHKDFCVRIAALACAYYLPAQEGSLAAGRSLVSASSPIIESESLPRGFYFYHIYTCWIICCFLGNSKRRGPVFVCPAAWDWGEVGNREKETHLSEYFIVLPKDTQQSVAGGDGQRAEDFPKCVFVLKYRMFRNNNTISLWGRIWQDSRGDGGGGGSTNEWS